VDASGAASAASASMTLQKGQAAAMTAAPVAAAWV
jgi:hypothetical protein